VRALLAALGIVLLAGCAGSGVPKAERSPLLEKAKAAGTIDGYRVLAHRAGWCSSARAYGIDDGGLAIRVDDLGVNNCHGPQPLFHRRLEIWYTRAAHEKALALWRLAGWGSRIECVCSPEKEASR